ncbi:MAG: flagellar protein FlaG [Desulfobacterium sp.]|nr:flagellar protein FlaG [Desulfobacterium sp.]MBU3949762.1 flagellar protein FlaG [Pseudomonadota bacterium]MBU4037930.1 flagellar protein FlaG [Pseudomonadota bacterium]
MSLEPVSLAGKNQNSLSRSNASMPVEGNGRSVEDSKPSTVTHVDEVLADLQNKMKNIHNIDLSFSVHKASGKIVVSVVDENTGEVIREIPSSEALDLSAKIEETIGLILDKKV